MPDSMDIHRLALALLVGGAMGCGASEDECQAPDESTRSALVLDIGDYPVDVPDDYQLDDVACTVAALDTSQPTVVRTELACDGPTGATHTIVIEHASSDLGEPAWSTGDALRLGVGFLIYSDLNGNQLFAVKLTAPDGTLRLFAVDSDTLMESVAAPLQLSLDTMACGTDEQLGRSRGLLTLTLDGASVRVADANDATLETSKGSYAVELEQAISGDFGERGLFFELLVMQVQ